jgi:ArsR family transcriptional regulator
MKSLASRAPASACLPSAAPGLPADPARPADGRAAVPMDDDAALSTGLAALAHPVRLAILRHLARHDACCCGEIVRRIDLAQSTVSQHLKVLVSAGLVHYEPQARRSRYTVNRPALDRLAGRVGALLGDCCAARRKD